MADIQDKPEVNRDTIRLIEAAIRETKPDLVVLTGDQIRGYDPAYIDTFLRRRGEKPGARVRLITEIEARIYGVKRRYPEAAELAERMADRLEDRGHTAPAVLTGDEPQSIDELMAESGRQGPPNHPGVPAAGCGCGGPFCRDLRQPRLPMRHPAR